MPLLKPMTCTAMWLLTVISCVLVTQTHAASLEVLPPPSSKSASPEAAIIIVPGASIDGAAYKPLASRLQEVSPLKLWVVLLEGFIVNTPNPVELNTAVPSAIAELRMKGMTSDNVFLAGHSLGGVFVGSYGKGHSSALKGIILFASYLTRDVNLASFPLPVLTLSGDMDGQTRITRIVDSFQQLEESVHHSASSKYRYPVIVMPGVSHAQFASGTMPKAVVDKDLTPEASWASAYSSIAGHTSAFMLATLSAQVQGGTASQAMQHLDQAYIQTQAIMQPLLTMKAMDVNPSHSDQWASQAQRLVAGLSPNQVQVKNQILSLASFLTSKPTLHKSGSSLELETFAHLTYPLNPLDISTTPSSPQELAFKLNSHEAVQAAMPHGTTYTAGSQSLSCQDLNQAAFDLALKTASADAQRRYQASGRPMTFQADVSHSTGLTWSSSSLQLSEKDSGVTVTSHALKTPLGGVLAFLGGKLYCKALSPYRAMEWIYVDSLRDHAI